jgi:hypothetical protein
MNIHVYANGVQAKDMQESRSKESLDDKCMSKYVRYARHEEETLKSLDDARAEEHRGLAERKLAEEQHAHVERALAADEGVSFLYR